jgi:hypothetical protein
MSANEMLRNKLHKRFAFNVEVTVASTFTGFFMVSVGTIFPLSPLCAQHRILPRAKWKHRAPRP